MILLAGAPAVVGMAALTGCSLTEPASIRLLRGVRRGRGGHAVLSSTLSHAGRDALLAVYLVELVLMLTPVPAVTGFLPSLTFWLSATNPYVGLEGLVFEDTRAACASIVIWLVLGFVSATAAAWKLGRPCRGPAAGGGGTERTCGGGSCPGD